jgi:hypothetical protein
MSTAHPEPGSQDAAESRPLDAAESDRVDDARDTGLPDDGEPAGRRGLSVDWAAVLVAAVLVVLVGFGLVPAVPW